MIYTVTWFNYVANSDMVSHVNANSELDAALIVHTNFWTNQREFDFKDYNVCEYSEDYILTRNDSHWTDEEFEKAKFKAIGDFVKDNYKYYKKDNLIEHLIQECKEKLGASESTIINLINDLEKE